MKKIIIIGSVIAGVLILAAIVFVNTRGTNSPAKNEFAASGSATDIRTITAAYSKTDPEFNEKLEEQAGVIYRKIAADKSKKASRIIGVIEGKKITAKKIELCALSYQVFGSKNPYKSAWNAMKLNIYEEKLAREYDIAVDQEAKKELDETREEMTEKPEEQADIKKISEAYGVSEADYWDVLQYQRMKRLVLHNTLSTYLSDHKLPAIDTKSIESKITDQEYIDKIENNK